MIQIHHGDCLKILPTITQQVSAFVTDPPYGTQGNGNGYGRRQLHDNGNGMGQTIANDENLDAIASAYPMLSHMTKTGWGMVFFAPRRTPEFIAATSGADWFGSVVWDKKQPGLGYHIRYAHEDIAVFRIGEPERPKDPLLSVIRCPHTPTTGHPHEKPVALLQRLILWATNPGDVVIDPFMGTGSTAVACVKTGRSFIGCELSEVRAVGENPTIPTRTAQNRLMYSPEEAK